MILYTKTKEPPVVPEGYSACFIGKSFRLLFVKEYAWSIVPSPPSRVNVNAFTEKVNAFLKNIPRFSQENVK